MRGETGYPPEYYAALRRARAAFEDETTAWERLSVEFRVRVARLQDQERRCRLDKPQRFTLLPEHLTLLRHARVTWHGDEWGAPGIDVKRPYGSSGDLAEEVARVLGWPQPSTQDGERAMILHGETEVALQIVLLFGTDAMPGEYELADRYSSRSWRKVVS
jgi:hypothetical protein